MGKIRRRAAAQQKRGAHAKAEHNIDGVISAISVPKREREVERYSMTERGIRARLRGFCVPLTCGIGLRKHASPVVLTRTATRACRERFPSDDGTFIEVGREGCVAG